MITRAATTNNLHIAYKYMYRISIPHCITFVDKFAGDDGQQTDSDIRGKEHL